MTISHHDKSPPVWALEGMPASARLLEPALGPDGGRPLFSWGFVPLTAG